MDKRIYIIVFLAVTGAVLTFVRELNTSDTEPLLLSFTTKREISSERVVAIADTVLQALGVPKKNIRPITGKNDIRVLYPEKFDVLNFISVINDSLDGYNAEVFSIENVKEKTSVVQIKSRDVILKSFIFSKEPQLQKKGAVPLAPKKPARQ